MRAPSASPANSKASAAVANATGIVASSGGDRPGGAGTTSSARVTTSGPNAPPAKPTTRSPGSNPPTSGPVSKIRPAISAPSVGTAFTRPMPTITSRKFAPAASTATLICPAPRAA